ncbi:LysR substrate-binding domain-containing protein [Streptomyces caeni]|uniref:LysR substrate-binding domain-containing protein n=1 Tax=Streptomyces caeni TaxID=2307231 RepID=A0ABW4IP47_9ACTN
MPLPRRVTELSGFELLLSIATLGSIGRAASAHGISQPAASERIHRLESSIGIPLVTRSPRGSQLTESGLLIADWARKTIESARDLEAGIAALRGQKDARLRVAASLTVAEYFVPRWLVRLRARDPHIAVALVSGNSADVADAMLSGKADLGFVEGPDLPPGLEAQIIAHDHLVLVVARRHPWARRKQPIQPSELARTPLISREQGSGTRRALERALSQTSTVTLPPPLLELSSTTAIKSAVIEGMGPAVLSSNAVAGELAAGTLVRLPIQGVNLTRDLRVIWPAGQRLQGPAGDLAAIAANAQTG